MIKALDEITRVPNWICITETSNLPGMLTTTSTARQLFNMQVKKKYSDCCCICREELFPGKRKNVIGN